LSLSLRQLGKRELGGYQVGREAESEIVHEDFRR